MRYIIASFTTLSLLLAGLIAAPAFAQTASNNANSAVSGTYCPQISRTLVRGSEDVRVGNTWKLDVTELQKFLIDHYNIAPETFFGVGGSSGYFGRMTQQYAVKFQKEQGLPSAGTVGPLTRSVIAKVCANSKRSQPVVPITILNPLNQANTPSATINASSLSAGSANPTITGTYMNGGIVIIITKGNVTLPVSRDTALPVVWADQSDHGGGVNTLPNGTFSDYVSTQLTNGVYTVGIYSANSTYTNSGFQGYGTQTLLASGTLTVSAPQVLPTANTTAINVSISISSGNPSSGPAPFAAFFAIQGQNLTGDSIDYGDGTPVSILACGGSNCSSAQYPSHTYTSPGTYVVRVLANNVTLATVTVAVTSSSAATCSGIATGNSNCLTVNSQSGSAPFTVAFTTASTPADSYTIDFGDGTKSGQLAPQSCTSSTPASCVYVTSHTYQSSGVFNAILASVQAIAGYAAITVNGSRAAPSLSAISPSTFSALTQVTLTGSGFISTGDEILIDGRYSLNGPSDPTSDTSQVFVLPSLVSDKNSCADFYASLPAGSGGGCQPAYMALPAGQHTLVFQNVNGTSNALSFTITQ